MIRGLVLNAVFVLVVIAGGISHADGAQKKISDAQVKKAVIKESIATYPGNCPCPYSTARNGSRCGGRSAYSRPGGYAPICYPRDVTEEMISQWRENHK